MDPVLEAVLDQLDKELEKGTPSCAVLKEVRNRLAAFGQRLPRKVGDTFAKRHDDSPLAVARRTRVRTEELLAEVKALQTRRHQ